ncbi:MAG: hypothetical protein KJO55_10845 [Gammaproteobacteria bacterium]|nr:hypothetical protein [Gammaproteobacteria bacterium]
MLAFRNFQSGLVLIGALSVCACASQHTDAGDYRIVTATDGLMGLRCQPRTEFYYLGQNLPDATPVYLGTCSTPKFVTNHLGMPANPSCFAVAEDGASLVYFHRPQWCGAGERAARKPGGVYLHSAKQGGDTLIYSDDQVSQVWSQAAVEPHSIRVTWHSPTPSRGGAVCSQRLVIAADGTETPEGEPTTVHGCQD